MRRGLFQPPHGLRGQPRAKTRHNLARLVTGVHNPSARQLWRAAVRGLYTTASSAVVHPIMPSRSPHPLGDHLVHFGGTDVACTWSLCQDHVFPSCPDLGPALRGHATRVRRWHHMEHWWFDQPETYNGARHFLKKERKRDRTSLLWYAEYMQHSNHVALGSMLHAHLQK